MPNVRPLNKRYGISKHAFLTAYSYCLQYKEWKKLLERSEAQEDKEEQERIKERVQKIEDTVREVVSEYPALYPYMLEYVTEEDTTFRQMEQKGIPCGSTMFYQLRRKFYYLMSGKI